MQPKRHIVRGLLAGLLLGLGLMLLVISYAKAPFGVATPYVCLIGGVIAGTLMGALGPVRTTGRPADPSDPTPRGTQTQM